VDATAPPCVADDAFSRVRALSEERRRHPQIAALVLRSGERVCELVERISIALVFKHHVVGEIVDDARRSVALRRRLYFDGYQSGRRGDLIEKVAGCCKSRFWQHREKLSWRIGRRRTACEAVSVNHYAMLASVWPIDSELPRPARTETFDV